MFWCVFEVQFDFQNVPFHSKQIMFTKSSLCVCMCRYHDNVGHVHYINWTSFVFMINFNIYILFTVKMILFYYSRGFGFGFFSLFIFIWYKRNYDVLNQSVWCLCLSIFFLIVASDYHSITAGFKRFQMILIYWCYLKRLHFSSWVQGFKNQISTF